jgi:PilZ domain
VNEIVTTNTSKRTIPIEVVGCDLDGMQFIEPSITVSITRDGAIILLENKLAPESELVVRNMQTGEEALGRVVGMMKGEVQGHMYGIAIPQQSENLWGVQFPPEGARNALLLKCTVCEDVVAALLLAIEEQVMEANHCLARSCDNCGAVTIWNRTDREQAKGKPTVSPAQLAAAAEEKAKEISSPPKEKRARKRAVIKMAACIRYSGIDSEVVCEDMSRGGFRFHSKTKYPADMRFEAAVPYAKSGANIFTPARIIYCQKLADGEYRHGVTYIKTSAPEDWNR